MQQSAPLGVGDGDVIDGFGITNDGLQQRVQAGICLQDFFIGITHRLRILHVNAGAAEVHFQGLAGGVVDLMSHKIPVFESIR